MIRLEESGPVILDSSLSMGVNTGREGIVSEGKGTIFAPKYLYGIFSSTNTASLHARTSTCFNCDA